MDPFQSMPDRELLQAARDDPEALPHLRVG
jgi:hypothetical protein